MQRDGLPTFRLAFDLPFYELRYATTPMEDLPRRGDGKGVRHYTDVSFLVPPSPGTSMSYLCQAHVSCAIFGTNDSRWEADMFLDTSLDSEETIEEYKYDPDDPEQMQQDPLRRGKAADKPILDPRLYYLDVLTIRIRFVRAKFRHILDTLRPTIEAQVSAHFLNSRPRSRSDMQSLLPAGRVK
ncbi:hypothetical protein EIK77_000022 [Talaromyces pinophilus]|nr:hypothetical protein EIK77_000022 [Talaromyces pinophilus]